MPWKYSRAELLTHVVWSSSVESFANYFSLVAGPFLQGKHTTNQTLETRAFWLRRDNLHIMNFSLC
jgi:hypothetical protein